AGTVTLDRLHLDTVVEQIRGALHNEQTKTQTICPAFICALKRVENRRQRAGTDAGAGIAHFDAQFRTAPVTGDKHPAPTRGVVDRIADQVSENTGQQDWVAQRRTARRRHAKGDPLAARWVTKLR